MERDKKNRDLIVNSAIWLLDKNHSDEAVLVTLDEVWNSLDDEQKDRVMAAIRRYGRQGAVIRNRLEAVQANPQDA